MNTPGNLRGPVKVVAGDTVLGGATLQHRKLVQLFGDTLAHGLCWLQGGQPLFEELQVGAAIILGQAEFFLDDFQLFAQKKLSLLLRDLFIHLAGDMGLHLGHFALFAQQHQHFFHARQQGQRIENFLQLVTFGGGQGGGEIRQQAGLVGAEVGHVVLQLFAVQRVQWQQFLDLLDERHGIGLDLVTVAIARAARVLHLHPIGRRIREPAHDTETLHPLHQELPGAIGAGWPVQARNTAYFRKLTGADVVGALLLHVTQAHQSVSFRGDGLQRGSPLLRVDRNGLHLTGEKRALRYWNHIQRIGEHIARHCRGLGPCGVYVRLVWCKFRGLAHACLPVSTAGVSARYGLDARYFKRSTTEPFFSGRRWEYTDGS